MFSDDNALIKRNFFFFVLKILLLIGLNIVLFYNFDKYKDPTTVILFNAGAFAVWFALWLKKTSRLYQKNLCKLPTTAKSAETPESREMNRRYREMALSDACKGKETDMRELQW